jgi:hypothetical protein
MEWLNISTSIELVSVQQTISFSFKQTGTTQMYTYSMANLTK